MEIDPAAIAYAPTTGVRRAHETAVAAASDENLRGLGCLVDEPQSFPIEITRWPAQGWRPVDDNSGDHGGVTEGLFEFWWKGETLYARNNAVGDTYLFGWSNWPEEATNGGPGARRERALIWRANYHPDGGQLFYPLQRQSFVVPLAPQVMTCGPSSSSPSGAMAVEGSTSTRMSGMAPSCRWTIRRHSSTARGVCMPASRSIFPRSSAAIWRRRFAEHRSHSDAVRVDRHLGSKHRRTRRAVSRTCHIRLPGLVGNGLRARRRLRWCSRAKATTMLAQPSSIQRSTPTRLRSNRSTTSPAR